MIFFPILGAYIVATGLGFTAMDLVTRNRRRGTANPAPPITAASVAENFVMGPIALPLMGAYVVASAANVRS